MKEMTLFEKMINKERLEAFLDYRENKQRNDSRLCSMREYLLGSRYRDDVSRLASGDYYISVPVRKTIPKRYTNKRRTVYHYTEDEMTLFRMMAFVLHDYEYIVPEQVYSFKIGVAAKDLIMKMSRDRKLRDMYVVKADIVSYGNSIDAGRLAGMIRDVFADRDPRAADFFTWLLLRKQYISNGVLMEGDTAALPGIPVHSFFTNLYLTDIDRKFIERCIMYARYSDDIIMFQSTAAEAEQNMSLLLSEMEDHGLCPHDDERTGIYEPGKPYDYLGFAFSGKDVEIARISVRKLKHKMRVRAKSIGSYKNRSGKRPEDMARHLIRLNSETFFGKPGSNNLCWSRWAFPVITGTKRLHELDLYNQQCIRYVMTGKWSRAQYRVKYSKLKEMGYKSLVRAYYEYRGFSEN